MQVYAVEDLQSQLDALDKSISQTSSLTAGFVGEMDRMTSSLANVRASSADFEKSLSRGLKKAIDGIVFDGMKLSDALRSVSQSLIQTAFDAAVKPMTDHFGSVIGKGLSSLLGFADGGSFSQGRVMPFANGGVIGGPTFFPMRGGLGLMGEAGPEAIMPLARGADGKLGVRTQGGGGGSVHVTMNIQTPDVEGFRRSQSQIAARMGRMLGQGQRNR
jgi:phage-related minor tail protein